MNRLATSRSSAIPGGVWMLGFVSLLMDTSSELIHALLPLYMVGTLGASMVLVGAVEGIAESLALVVRVFSGYASDRQGRRKPLVLLGYGLAAATKIVFPLAVSLPWVVGARFIDRVGKGIRGAPRDALIADLTPDTVRGRAFGLRQALDTIGAVAGPLLAVGAMALFAGSFRAAFGVALIPAALCVALLVLGVREPPGTSAVSARKLSWRDAGRLGLAFYITTTIAVVMTLARFSEAFLVLRARDVGLDAEHAPWVMVTMSAVYAVLAFPAGRAADHGRVIALLVGGFAALAISDIVLALATGPSVVMAGAACWGVHMALTQGVLAALVAAAAPAELRGTAFGVFNLASGAALLVASALAGVLWQAIGPAATFLAGAAFTCVGLLGVLVFRRVLPRDAANTGTRTQSNRAA